MHPEYEDVAHLLLEYGDLDLRASIQVSWLSPQKVSRVTTVGSKKMAVYDDLAADKGIRAYDKAVASSSRIDRLAAWNMTQRSLRGV